MYLNITAGVMLLGRVDRIIVDEDFLVDVGAEEINADVSQG